MQVNTRHTLVCLRSLNSMSTLEKNDPCYEIAIHHTRKIKEIYIVRAALPCKSVVNRLKDTCRLRFKEFKLALERLVAVVHADVWHIGHSDVCKKENC